MIKVYHFLSIVDTYHSFSFIYFSFLFLRQMCFDVMTIQEASNQANSISLHSRVQLVISLAAWPLSFVICSPGPKVTSCLLPCGLQGNLNPRQALTVIHIRRRRGQPPCSAPTPTQPSPDLAETMKAGGIVQLTMSCQCNLDVVDHIYRSHIHAWRRREAARRFIPACLRDPGGVCCSSPSRPCKINFSISTKHHDACIH